MKVNESKLQHMLTEDGGFRPGSRAAEPVSNNPTCTTTSSSRHSLKHSDHLHLDGLVLGIGIVFGIIGSIQAGSGIPSA